MRFFKKIHFEDANISRFQDNVEDAVDQITRTPIIGGVLVENISLLTGVDNAVSHKLGVKPTMWMLARKFDNADVWEVSGTATANLLTLRCSANVTVNLWVA